MKCNKKRIAFEIDEELYKKVKIKAIKLGVPLKCYIRELLLDDLSNDKKKSEC
jgi:predicted DNA binding CopG/RHH family protein